ncbi:GON-4-like protein [Pteropus vampyrus]|uniref:GON-4-like protein n=1 Tax=Pteropus vampyrus TaxID=132908 RepID=A0A6P6CTG8_PTEVA|nr:GON-4-like protein [Pteropus vampyrus]
MRSRPRLLPNGPRQKTPPLSEKFRKAGPAPFRKISGGDPAHRLDPAHCRAVSLLRRKPRGLGWNKSRTFKMVPSKKRRTAVTESPQHQGIQEDSDLDLELADKPGSEQVESLGSSSLPQGLETPSVQDAAYPLGVEAPSLSSGLLTQDAGAPVPEAVGVAAPKGSALASPESSRPRDTHTGKENLQAAGAKRGKKMTLRPRPVPQEDRSDPPVTKEPFPGEPGEDVQGEGRPQAHSGGALPWLQDSQPARGVQPRPSAQPDVRAPPPEKPLGTCARQAEEEGEDGGLFIPMGRLPFSSL